jgi:hypothetical protein
MLPLVPDLALCMSCHWIATGPDANDRAAQHRNDTSHAVIASPTGTSTTLGEGEPT